ncbi:MAG: methyltransferase domain-containing protein [Clostridiaceae bacterium]|nr:methyltransferase domain-containing protein [Clostridiaceae bacterium]
MTKISVSFQLLPQTESDLQYEIVDDVLDFFKETPEITYVVGPMDTVLEGEADIIIPLIEKSIKHAHERGVETVMSYLKIVSSDADKACGFLDGVSTAMDNHNKSLANPPNFNDNVERYNYLATPYDSWYDQNKEIFEAEVQAIRKVLPENCKPALEIGGGSGRFAEALDLDKIVEPAEKLAAKAIKRKVDVVDAYAEDLPFEEAMFSTVLFLTSLEFVNDTEQAIAEAFRVLKPNGSLIIAYLNASEEVAQQMKTDSDESVYYEDANFLTKEKIGKLLENHSAKIVDIASVQVSDKGIQLSSDDNGIYTVVRAQI